jgi:hypothetical protein
VGGVENTRRHTSAEMYLNVAGINSRIEIKTMIPATMYRHTNQYMGCLIVAHHHMKEKHTSSKQAMHKMFIKHIIKEERNHQSTDGFAGTREHRVLERQPLATGGMVDWCCNSHTLGDIVRCNGERQWKADRKALDACKIHGNALWEVVQANANRRDEAEIQQVLLILVCWSLGFGGGRFFVVRLATMRVTSSLYNLGFRNDRDNHQEEHHATKELMMQPSTMAGGGGGGGARIVQSLCHALHAM